MKKYIDVTDIRSGKLHFVDREKRDEVNTYWKGWNDALDAVADHPPADVRENTHGRWMRKYSRPNVFADLFYHCSACGGKSSDNWAAKFTFCPYCGAYMQDPEENDGE